MDQRKINQIPLDIKKSSIFENNKKFISKILDTLNLISFWKNMYTWIYIFFNIFLISIYSILLYNYYNKIDSKIPIFLLNNNFNLYPKIFIFIPLIFLVFDFAIFLYLSYKSYYKIKSLYFMSNTLGLIINTLIVLDIYKILQIVI